MKKIKLLITLATISIIGDSFIPLSSCGCSQNINQHTITFTCSDGVTLVGETTFKINENTKWKDVTKPTANLNEGYTAFGWCKDNTKTLIEDEFVITSDLTVKYIADVTQCTISFSCSEGVTLTGAKTITVPYGTKWSDLNKPEVMVDETAYTGLDWYISGTLEKLSSDTPIKGNIDVKYYALKNSETFIDVTINNDTKTYEPVRFLQRATWKEFKEYWGITKDPEKTGCVFDGWFYGDIKLTDDWTFPEITTITIKARFSSSEFLTDGWENVCKYAEQGLDALKDHYKLTTFIEIQRTININNVNLKVRVIDENHDDLADKSGKAALTFELVNVMCDSAHYPLRREWGWSDYKNKSFPTSVLYNALNSTGQISWGRDSQSTGTFEMKSAYAFLLDNGIKPKKVNKVVANGDDYSTNNPYSCFCFPLTCTEIGVAGSEKKEGNTYQYYITHSTPNYRYKYGKFLNRCSYWLASPSTTDDTKSWIINNSGYQQTSEINELFDNKVSFAFCI